MHAPHFSVIALRLSGMRSVSRRRFLVLALPLVLIAVMCRTAAATNGTWINATSGGLWSVASNWAGGTIANGTDGIADFSTLDITADDTVHLDSARTIGELVFGDTAPSNNWILDNNGNAANTLTMASVGNTHITVNNDQAQINLDLQGAGVVINGPGTLLLGGATDNTALGIVVTGGNVVLNKASNSGVHAIGGGGLTINGGNVQLRGTGGDQIYDPANVTVNSGTFDANGQSETFNVLSLAGTGIGGNGALLNSSPLFSTITPTGGTVLTANATIGVTSPILLSILTLNSTISGAFGLTKVGPGTLILGGSTANTFTGTTTVNAGTLMLDKPFGAQAIGGNLIIGTGTGLPGSAVVLDVNNFELGAFAPPNVTIQSDGALNLQTFGEVIDNLTMTGGSVTNGLLVLNGTSITTKASNYTATISSRLQIQSAQFTIAQGTTASGIDLDVSGTIIDDNLTFGSITKSGLGALRLSGNSTFSGGVTLSAGTLIIGNNNALGTGTLTVSGGALAADSNGPYVVSNPVSLLTTLIVSGGGNFTLAGPINGTGGLTTTGTGALTLSGVESFTGPININSGSLVMSTSLSNNVTNAGTFVYNSGTFGGRLTNLGTVILNAAFTAANGMENDGTFTLATGQTITLNGAGLNNEGTFTMTGGTLNLNPAGNNVNRGNFSLPANLGLGTATLTNSGSLVLSSGVVSGASGTLVNTAGGTVSGSGAITSGFSNSGGLVSVGGGTLNIIQPFTNNGEIQLTAINANLAGGGITNINTIQGFGNIGNPLANAGTIESIDGTLFISGGLTNSSAGLIRADAGSKVIVASGLATNSGIINLVGGTFDNNEFPLNNTGQVSGFGIFATGSTGLINNGSITFSGGLTTVNGPVTNEGGRTITVAQNNAIFTGLVTNNASATFNAVNAVATFAGGFVNNGNSNFIKAGGGVVEIDAAPTLNNGSTLSVTTGTLRFNVISGAPTIGTGVTAVVSAGATLELAGSVAALANGPNRVNIINNSNAPGVLVSGTNQQVGNIDGSGTTQVNAGSDLTANHIIQGALVIGGTPKNLGLVTIDASDSSGNPLVSLAVLASPIPGTPFGAEVFANNSFNGDSVASSPTSFVSGMAPDSAAVPEPASLLLLAIGSLALVRSAIQRRSRT